TRVRGRPAAPRRELRPGRAAPRLDAQALRRGGRGARRRPRPARPRGAAHPRLARDDPDRGRPRDGAAEPRGPDREPDRRGPRVRHRVRRGRRGGRAGGGCGAGGGGPRRRPPPRAVIALVATAAGPFAVDLDTLELGPGPTFDPPPPLVLNLP